MAGEPVRDGSPPTWAHRCEPVASIHIGSAISAVSLGADHSFCVVGGRDGAFLSSAAPARPNGAPLARLC